MLKLDKYDIAILEALQREGRITKLRLSEIVGLSQTPCHERVKRLEQHSLITEYNARIDLAKISSFMTFFVTVILESHQAAAFQKFESSIRRHPQILECYALGGGIDYILKIVEKDIAAYQTLIDSLLESHVGIDQYYTYVVTKAVFTGRSAPLSYFFQDPENSS